MHIVTPVSNIFFILGAHMYIITHVSAFFSFWGVNLEQVGKVKPPPECKKLETCVTMCICTLPTKNENMIF